MWCVTHQLRTSMMMETTGSRCAPASPTPTWWWCTMRWGTLSTSWSTANNLSFTGLHITRHKNKAKTFLDALAFKANIFSHFRDFEEKIFIFTLRASSYHIFCLQSKIIFLILEILPILVFMKLLETPWH